MVSYHLGRKQTPLERAQAVAPMRERGSRVASQMDAQREVAERAVARNRMNPNYGAVPPYRQRKR